MTATLAHWPLWKLFLFRWAALYGLLFFSGGFWNRPWHSLAVWAAKLWGHDLLAQSGPNGSGDTLENYIFCALWLVAALLLALIWSLIERRGTFTGKLAWPAHTLLRYVLGWYLLYYGWSKVFQSQMPLPDLVQLAKPLGEKSPMGLLWTMVGVSPLYEIAGGWAEVVSGLLLLFRRTSLLGAALGAGVMAYVFLLNLSFDVPVKLLSGHLLLYCLLTLVPFLPRLWAFIRGGSVPAMTYPAPPQQPVWRWVGWVWRVLALGIILVLPFQQVRQAHKLYGDWPSSSKLVGIYQVQTDSVAPNQDMSFDVRWHTLVIGDREYGNGNQPPVRRAALTLVNGTRTLGNYQDDPKTSTLTLFMSGNNEAYQYSHNGFGDLVLKSATRQLVLTPKPEGTLLTTRGFHWVNERPLNR